MKRPSFNHSRADGPYDPCEECMRLMKRSELMDVIRDLRDRNPPTVEGRLDRIEGILSRKGLM